MKLAAVLMINTAANFMIDRLGPAKGALGRQGALWAA
jgi:hypothetical protein